MKLWKMFKGASRKKKGGIIGLILTLIVSPFLYKAKINLQSRVGNTADKVVNKTIDHIKNGNTDKVVDSIKDIVCNEVKDGLKIGDKDSTSEKKSHKYVYSGKYNETIGKAKFNIKVVDGVKYGKKDKFGRPTYATIRVTPKIYAKEKKEKREAIKINPDGWPKKNTKVVIKHKDGSTYKGYMWNRSHMIADSLGGDPVYENLVTGTRPQNVGGRGNNGGMAYLEEKIRSYYNKGGKGTVDYTVENVYKSNSDKLPIYSICNAKSSDGKIDEMVVVYNSAEGYNINYKDATFKKQ